MDEVGTPQYSSLPSTTRLPAVNAPKTSAVRCRVCRKKTSLATSFQCRWLETLFIILITAKIM